MKKKIYLDHNATTPPHPKFLDALQKIHSISGNPSSHHQIGRIAKEASENARYQVASLINASPKQLLWIPSGSQANNMIIKNILWNHLKTKTPAHIITSSIEHPCVLEACKWAASFGISITYLPAQKDGRVSPNDVKNAITPNTQLISIMLANNETGMIQPLSEIAKIARDHQIPCHTDAIQAVGKISVSLPDLGVDFLTLSGHKFNGPKGIAALYAKNLSALTPLVHGGPQEQQKNAGTENIPGIIGIGIAAQARQETLAHDISHTQTLRNTLKDGLITHFADIHLNTDTEHALPNTLNVSFLGIKAESLAIRLDLEGIAVSTGSACSTGTPYSSSVLFQMGLPPEVVNSALRFSLGAPNTIEEIHQTLTTLETIIPKLRSLS